MQQVEGSFFVSALCLRVFVVRRLRAYIVDHFVEFFGMCLICLVEIAAVAFFLRAGRLRAFLNSGGKARLGAWWEVCLQVVAPVALSSTFALLRGRI